MKKKEYLEYFPKETPYKGQLEAMEKIKEGITNGNIILFEGACGTGKTLASLAPALSQGKKTGKTVVIATNVHQQMRQFIEESKEIHNLKKINTIVFKGKNRMCLMDKDYEECDLVSDMTYNLLELQEEKKNLTEELRNTTEGHNKLKKEVEEVDKKISRMKENCCSYLLNTLSKKDDFNRWIFSKVRSTDEIIDWGLKNERCVYEKLKREVTNADLIICNYRHILDPNILEKFSKWMGGGVKDGRIRLDDLILVLDEAHNLPSVSRDLYSYSLTDTTIKRAIGEIRDQKDNKFHEIDITSIEEFFLKFDEIVQGLKPHKSNKIKDNQKQRIIVQNIKNNREHDLISSKIIEYFGEKAKDILQSSIKLGFKLEEKYKKEIIRDKKQSKTSYIRIVSGFLLNYLKKARKIEYYPYVEQIKRKNTITKKIVLFNCLSEGKAGSIIKSTHSSILMSATLRPMEKVSKSFGFNNTKKILETTKFPEDNRITLAVNTPPLFASKRKKDSIIKLIKSSIEATIDSTPGSTLIFFPNFHEAKRYYNIVESDIKKLLDKKGKSSSGIRKSLFEGGESGSELALFSYIWGTMTEGLDYKGKIARSVVIVGVPYPRLDDKRKAIKKAYEDIEGNGWEYGVEIPTIRKVKQAIGRVIRSQEDIGARILIDGRYTPSQTKKLGDYSVYSSFPRDFREEIVETAPKSIKYDLKKFFENKT